MTLSKQSISEYLNIPLYSGEDKENGEKVLYIDCGNDWQTAQDIARIFWVGGELSANVASLGDDNQLSVAPFVDAGGLEHTKVVLFSERWPVNWKEKLEQKALGNPSYKDLIKERTEALAQTAASVGTPCLI